MTRFGTLLVILAVSACGCRSSSKSQNTDPLYGRYIPKQDLPMPTRDASKGRDPLLVSPTSKTEPFRNTKATTVANLAANVKVEDSGLSMGDRRGTAEPAMRGVPLRRSVETASGVGESWERSVEELRRMRARYDNPIRDGNEYVMTANVPNGPDGAMRRYEASGSSAAAAAKQLVDQIKADQEK
jgi:hypothetical protein